MTNHLATYLNDHLAGSSLALEMLGHLEAEHSGEPISEFAAGLKAEIEADRGQLEALMAHLGIAQSVARKAGGWVSEKAARVKLRLDDPLGGELRLLEMLEALALGIDGKHALWKGLEAASDVNLGLRPTHYASLMQRAEEQRAGVEKWRLEAAKKAFGTPPIAEKG